MMKRRDDSMDDLERENEQRLSKLEASTASAHKRIDGVESVQKEIRDLAMSVNTLAGNLSHLCKEVTGIGGRLTDIESKPAKRLDMIIGVLITALITTGVGVVIGYFLAR